MKEQNLVTSEFTFEESEAFPLPRHRRLQNKAAIEKSQELDLWTLPHREGILAHNKVKHDYPYFGNVVCPVGDEEFCLFSVNDDVVAWMYFWLKSYEPVLMNKFLQLATDATRVLDVGAYTGCYALAAARVGAQVDAFEMVPRTVERLKINVYLNALRRSIDVHPFGVSNEASTIEIHMPRNSEFLGTGNSVEAKGHVDSISSTTCNVRRLDDWWEEVGCPKIDLIKLDVEEHEVQALEGSLKLLIDSRPTLLIEIETGNLPAVTKICDELNYEFERIEGTNYLMKPS